MARSEHSDEVFYIGQVVKCINADPEPGEPGPHPNLNRLYTIVGFSIYEGDTCLLFKELPMGMNEDEWYKTTSWSYGFMPEYFEAA